jgi:copper chaperone CopZ
MSTENVTVQIDSKADLRGFKQVESAATKLNKTIKNLAGALGISYGTQAVIDFGKASVKAFMDTQKASTQLSNTVKNLGLSFADADIQNFAKHLSLTTGVMDEQLLPAMQKLLQVTGSIQMSQKLLTQSIDISKGSGVDLATVVGDIANAYVGNNKGLKKYALGLSMVELKTASFNRVMTAFNRNFAGATQANLETTAGKMDLLTNAAHEAMVTIGGGLVDAFAQLSGGGSVTAAADSINYFADAVAAMERGAGTAIGTLPTLYDKIKQAGKSFFFGFVGKQFNLNVPTAPKPKEDITAKQKADALAKSEAAAKKRAAELAAQTLKSQKALTAEQKKQADLKKAGTVFDMQQIELVAALKGKLSDDEKIRAEAQLALLNGNVEVAQKLTSQILAAQDSTGNLARFLASLPDAKNPFQYLDAYLNGLAAKAAALGAATVNGASSVTAVNPSVASSTGNLNTGTPDYFTTLASQGAGASGGFSPVVAAAMAQPVINVTVQGSVIKEQELIDAVQAGLQSSSLSGAPSQIGRILGMFG